VLLNKITLRLRRDDEGAALVVVIGLMAVGMLLTSLIMSSSISGVGFTSSTRAGVQSQASAEAGVEVALAGIRAGSCASKSGIYASAADATPIYRAEVWSQNGGGTWTQSCPVSNTVAIKIVSGGTADALGVAGQSGNDRSNVEAIFSTTPQDTSILATGPAVYAYSSQGFAGSGTLVSADGAMANVMVKEGNVTCSGGAGMAADLVVNNGNLTLSGSCNVTGHVWVSGKLTMSGGVRVSGNISAAEIEIPNGTVGGSAWSKGKVTIGTATIAGSLVAGGNVSLSSTTIGQSVWSSADVATVWGTTINGGVTAKTISMGGGDIKGMSWATASVTHNGWYTVTGSVTTKQLNLGNGPTPRYKGSTTVSSGGVGTGPIASPAPTAPFIPAWVDFTYKESDWTGFAHTSISGACDYNAFQGAVNSFGSRPGVIDARGCSAAITISGYQQLTIQNDLAIIANSWNFGGSGSIYSASNRKLWLITPDDTADHLPTCTAPKGNFTDGGGFKISTTIDAMVYTPCQVNIGSSIQWRGQVFGGKVVVDGGSKFTFKAVGLPGVDLSTGIVDVPSTEDAVWSLESTRNLPLG